MKKYIVPSFKVVTLNNEIILAGSNVGTSTTILNGTEEGFQRGAKKFRDIADDELEEEFYDTEDEAQFI